MTHRTINDAVQALVSPNYSFLIVESEKNFRLELLQDWPQGDVLEAPFYINSVPSSAANPSRINCCNFFSQEFLCLYADHYERLVLAMVSGSAFSPEKMNSYFVRNMDKPVHNCILGFNLRVGGFYCERESEFTTFCDKMSGYMDVSEITGSPDFGYCWNQTPDLLQLVRKQDYIMHYLKFMERETIGVGRGGRVSVSDSSDLDSLPEYFFVFSDAAVGASPDMRRKEKRKHYYHLHRCLSKMSEISGYPIVYIDMIWERDVSLIEDFMSRCYNFMSDKYCSWKDLNMERDYMEALPVFMKNTEWMYDTFDKLYGQDVVKSITSRSYSLNTSLYAGPAVMEKMAECCLENRVLLNNPSEIKKVLFEDGSEESLAITAKNLSAMDYSYIDFVKDEIISAVNTGSRKLKMRSTQTIDYDSLKESISTSQQENSVGVVPKPDKALSSIPWCKVSCLFDPQQDRDAMQDYVDATGDTSVKVPENSGFVLPSDMDEAVGRTIIDRILRESPLRDFDGLERCDSIVASSFSEGAYRPPVNRFIADCYNAIVDSCKNPLCNASYLPTNLFEQKTSFQKIKSLLRDMSGFEGMGLKMQDILINSNFKFDYAKGKRLKRFVNVKHSFCTKDDQARMGFSVTNTSEHTGVDYSRPSTYVPFEENYEAFKVGISAMFHADLTSGTSVRPHDIESMKQKLDSWFRARSTKDEKRGFENFLHTYTAFLKTEVGKITTFLHKLAMQCGADMARPRKQGQANLSKLSDNLYLLVFGREVSSGSSNDSVKFILLSFSSDWLLDSTKKCCNNFGQTDLNCGGLVKTIYHSDLLLMPRFFISPYFTLPFTLKQTIDMYRSLSPRYSKDEKESIAVSLNENPSGKDTIPETLLLVCCRFTLGTALVQSLSRYVGMHKLGKSTGFESFARDKLLLPIRNQADNFLICRYLDYCSSGEADALEKSSFRIFTEENQKFLSKKEVQVEVPSIMFDYVLAPPRGEMSFEAVHSIVWGPGNRRNLESSLSALPQEFYFVNIFSREVENAGSDARVVFADGIKLEKPIRDMRYKGSSSETRFNQLKAMRAQVGPEDQGYNTLLTQHYDPTLCQKHNIKASCLDASVLSGCDLNKYLKLNYDSDFNMYDTGLSKSGTMEEVFAMTSDIIHRNEKGKGCFVSYALSCGQRLKIDETELARGGDSVRRALDENHDNGKSSSKGATYKSTTVSDMEEPIDLPNIGHSRVAVKNSLSESMGNRAKRTTSMLALILCFKLPSVFSEKFSKTFKRNIYRITDKAQKFHRVFREVSMEVIKRHGSDYLKEMSKSTLQGQLPEEAVNNIAFNDIANVLVDCKESVVLPGLGPVNERETLTRIVEDFKSKQSTEKEGLRERCVATFSEILGERADSILNKSYSKLAEKGDPSGLVSYEEYKSNPDNWIESIKISIRETKSKRMGPSEVKMVQRLDKTKRELVTASRTYREETLKGEFIRFSDIIREIGEFIDTEYQEGRAGDLSDEKLRDMFVVLKYFQKNYSSKRNTRALRELKEDMAEDLAMAERSEEIADALMSLEGADLSSVSIHEAATFSLQMSKPYMIAQWFKKAQLIGVRPISIFDNNTATEILAVENISRKINDLDSSSTITDDNKVLIFTRLINEMFTFLKTEQDLDKFVHIINSSADCKGWCNEKMMTEFMALFAPMKEVCPNTVNYCFAVFMKCLVKKMEIPMNNLLTWLRSSAKINKNTYQSENSLEYKKKFLLDCIPILVITSGMLQGVFNFTSTLSQGAASTLKEKVFERFVQHYSQFDERLVDAKIKIKSLYGSDDLFDSMACSFTKLSTLVSKTNSYVKRKVGEIESLDRMVNAIESSRELDLSDKDVAQALGIDPRSDLDGIKELVASRKSDLLAEIEANSSNAELKDIKTLKKTETVLNIGDSTEYEKSVSLSDRELADLLENFYLVTQEVCLNLCNCNLSSKTAVINLILEYNSIFASLEGQNNCRIKFLLAANAMFGTTSPTKSIEESYNRLRQLVENYSPDSLYWNTLYCQEFLYNLSYSTHPLGRNFPGKAFGMTHEQLHYYTGCFPRLSQYIVCSENLSYETFRCLESSSKDVRKSCSMFYLVPSNSEDTDDLQNAESIVVEKIVTCLPKGKSYDRFLRRLESSGITRELLEKIIEMKPLVGIGGNKTVLDDVFIIISNYFSLGAQNSFRTDSAKADLRTLFTSKVSDMFKFHGEGEVQGTLCSVLAEKAREYEAFVNRNGELSPNVIQTNKETCEAIMTLQNFLEDPLVKTVVTDKKLENVRAVVTTVRATQQVGDISSSDYFLKVWEGVSRHSKSNASYARNRAIYNESIPKIPDDYNTFLSNFGMSQFGLDKPISQMTVEEIRENFPSVLAKRKYLKYISEKVKYKSEKAKSFRRSGNTSSLEKSLKDMVLTTFDDRYKVEVISENYMVHDGTLTDFKVTEVGIIKDFCTVFWNHCLASESTNLGLLLSVLASSYRHNSGTCLESFGNVVAPEGLQKYRPLTAQEKSILMSVIETTRLLDPVARRDCLGSLFGDFTSKGVILVLKAQSKPTPSDTKIFHCVCFLSSGLVQFFVTAEVIKGTKKKGHKGRPKINLSCTARINRKDFNSGIISCLAYYFNMRLETPPEYLAKKAKVELDCSTNSMTSVSEYCYLSNGEFWTTSTVDTRAPVSEDICFSVSQYHEEIKELFPLLKLGKCHIVKEGEELCLMSDITSETDLVRFVNRFAGETRKDNKICIRRLGSNFIARDTSVFCDYEECISTVADQEEDDAKKTIYSRYISIPHGDDKEQFRKTDDWKITADQFFLNSYNISSHRLLCSGLLHTTSGVKELLSYSTRPPPSKVIRTLLSVGSVNQHVDDFVQEKYTEAREFNMRYNVGYVEADFQNEFEPEDLTVQDVDETELVRDIINQTETGKKKLKEIQNQINSSRVQTVRFERTEEGSLTGDSFRFFVNSFPVRTAQLAGGWYEKVQRACRWGRSCFIETPPTRSGEELTSFLSRIRSLEDSKLDENKDVLMEPRDTYEMLYWKIYMLLTHVFGKDMLKRGLGSVLTYMSRTGLIFHNNEKMKSLAAVCGMRTSGPDFESLASDLESYNLNDHESASKALISFNRFRASNNINYRTHEIILYQIYSLYPQVAFHLVSREKFSEQVSSVSRKFCVELLDKEIQRIMTGDNDDSRVLDLRKPMLDFYSSDVNQNALALLLTNESFVNNANMDKAMPSEKVEIPSSLVTLVKLECSMALSGGAKSILLRDYMNMILYILLVNTGRCRFTLIRGTSDDIMKISLGDLKKCLQSMERSELSSAVSSAASLFALDCHPQFYYAMFDPYHSAEEGEDPTSSLGRSYSGSEPDRAFDFLLAERDNSFYFKHSEEPTPYQSAFLNQLSTYLSSPIFERNVSDYIPLLTAEDHNVSLNLLEKLLNANYKRLRSEIMQLALFKQKNIPSLYKAGRDNHIESDKALAQENARKGVRHTPYVDTNVFVDLGDPATPDLLAMMTEDVLKSRHFVLYCNPNKISCVNALTWLMTTTSGVRSATRLMVMEGNAVIVCPPELLSDINFYIPNVSIVGTSCFSTMGRLCEKFKNSKKREPTHRLLQSLISSCFRSPSNLNDNTCLLGSPATLKNFCATRNPLFVKDPKQVGESTLDMYLSKIPFCNFPVFTSASYAKRVLVTKRVDRAVEDSNSIVKNAKAYTVEEMESVATRLAFVVRMNDRYDVRVSQREDVRMRSRQFRPPTSATDKSFLENLSMSVGAKYPPEFRVPYVNLLFVEIAASLNYFKNPALIPTGLRSLLARLLLELYKSEISATDVATFRQLKLHTKKDLLTQEILSQPYRGFILELFRTRGSSMVLKKEHKSLLTGATPHFNYVCNLLDYFEDNYVLMPSHQLRLEAKDSDGEESSTSRSRSTPSIKSSTSASSRTESQIRLYSGHLSILKRLPFPTCLVRDLCCNVRVILFLCDTSVEDESIEFYSNILAGNFGYELSIDSRIALANQLLEATILRKKTRPFFSLSNIGQAFDRYKITPTALGYSLYSIVRFIRENSLRVSGLQDMVSGLADQDSGLIDHREINNLIDSVEQADDGLEINTDFSPFKFKRREILNDPRPAEVGREDVDPLETVIERQPSSPARSLAHEEAGAPNLVLGVSSSRETEEVSPAVPEPGSLSRFQQLRLAFENPDHGKKAEKKLLQKATRTKVVTNFADSSVLDRMAGSETLAGDFLRAKRLSGARPEVDSSSVSAALAASLQDQSYPEIEETPGTSSSSNFVPQQPQPEPDQTFDQLPIVPEEAVEAPESGGPSDESGFLDTGVLEVDTDDENTIERL